MLRGFAVALEHSWVDVTIVIFVRVLYGILMV